VNPKTNNILRCYLRLNPTTDDPAANTLLVDAQRLLVRAIVVLLGVPANSLKHVTVDKRRFTVHHSVADGVADYWVQPA